MWNFTHCSHICFLKDFKKEQDSYKKKLYKINPAINIVPPYKKRTNLKGYSYDKFKTKYNNKVLYKKTKDIKKSKGDYNQEVLRPHSSFSGIKYSNFDNYLKLERKSINEDNKKMWKRIKNVKPSYSVKTMRKDNIQHQKYRNFMLDVLRKNRATPLFKDEMENILNL